MSKQTKLERETFEKLGPLKQVAEKDFEKLHEKSLLWRPRGYSDGPTLPLDPQKLALVLNDAIISANQTQALLLWVISHLADRLGLSFAELKQEVEVSGRQRGAILRVGELWSVAHLLDPSGESRIPRPGRSKVGVH